MNTVMLNTVHLDGAPIIKKVSGGAGEGGGLRYFSLYGASFDAVYFSVLAKYRVNGECLIGPTLLYAEESESIEGANGSIEGAAFNFNTKITFGDTTFNNLFELWGLSSVDEFISRFGIIKEITEEQFYDPNFVPSA